MPNDTVILSLVVQIKPTALTFYHTLTEIQHVEDQLTDEFPIFQMPQPSRLHYADIIYKYNETAFGMSSPVV